MCASARGSTGKGYISRHLECSVGVRPVGSEKIWNTSVVLKYSQGDVGGRKETVGCRGNCICGPTLTTQLSHLLPSRRNESGTDILLREIPQQRKCEKF